MALEPAASVLQPFVADSIVDGIGFQAFFREGASLGVGAVLWVQKFFLQRLQAPNAVEYRKRQGRRGELEKRAVAWDLEDGFYVKYPLGVNRDAQLAIRTDLVLPWLFHQHRPQGHTRSAAFATIPPLIHAFADAAQSGLADVGELDITIDLEDGGSLVYVRNGGLVASNDHFQQRHRDVIMLWPVVQSRHRIRIGALATSTVMDWVVFCWSLETWCRPHVPDADLPWLRRLRNELAMVAAYGIDSHAVRAWAGAFHEKRELMEITTRSGRRRLDALKLTKALDRLKSIQGSSTTALAALCGDPTVDQAVTSTMVELYVQKMKREFLGVRLLNLNWDPSTHSGYQVNCGLGWDPSRQLAAILLPKVSV